MLKNLKMALGNFLLKKILQLFRDAKLEVDLLKNETRNVIFTEKVKLYPPYKIFNATIGDYTYIASNSKISYTEIGKFCSIGPNLVSGWGIHPINGISTSPTFYSTKKQNGFSFTAEDKVTERENIKIGNDVFIGMNVTILDGITIGDGAVIGAGAVVSKDIPPYAIAIGCPIKITTYRFSEEIIEKLMKIAWWNLPIQELKLIEEHFFDPELFTQKYE